MKEKPKPELVYDSVEVEEYLRKKYKFREYLMDEYIRETFTEYSNGTLHTISDENLETENRSSEYREFIDTLLDEFGTKLSWGREVKIHYWW